MKFPPIQPNPYNAIWSFWFAVLVAGEWWPHVCWPLAALAFAVLEWWGIQNHGQGKTFSEFVVRFYGHQPARIPLILGVAVYLGLGVASFLGGWHDELQVARIAVLSAGVTGWLVPHFLLELRRG